MYRSTYEVYATKKELENIMWALAIELHDMTLPIIFLQKTYSGVLVEESYFFQPINKGLPLDFQVLKKLFVILGIPIDFQMISYKWKLDISGWSGVLASFTVLYMYDVYSSSNLLLF